MKLFIILKKYYKKFTKLIHKNEKRETISLILYFNLEKKYFIIDPRKVIIHDL